MTGEPTALGKRSISYPTPVRTDRQSSVGYERLGVPECGPTATNTLGAFPTVSNLETNNSCYPAWIML